MGAVRSRLRRWHVWLGWLVGIPVLLWTLSGLVMVARPIEEVRGEHLVRPAPEMRLPLAPVAPSIGGLAVKSLKLEPRAAGPRWVVTAADGTTRLADPSSGALLPALSAGDAAREVAARYAGSAAVAGVKRVDPARPPLEFRRETPAWQVEMDDGTRFYVDAGSGEIVARRTRWWRIYDFMWGLHIMDLETREDAHNPLLIGFAIAGLAMSLLALVLLPLTVRRRRARRLEQAPEQA